MAQERVAPPLFQGSRACYPDLKSEPYVKDRSKFKLSATRQTALGNQSLRCLE